MYPKVKAVLRDVFKYRNRLYIYGVAFAAVPLAIWRGWMEPEMAPLALPLLIAILKLSPDTPPQTDVPDVQV